MIDDYCIKNKKVQKVVFEPWNNNGTIPILLGFMSFSGNVPYNKMPHVKSQARLNFNYSVLVLYTLANGGRGFWPNRGRLACFPAFLH